MGSRYVTESFEEEDLLARINTHLTLKHICQTLDLKIILNISSAEVRKLFNYEPKPLEVMCVP